MSWLFTSGGQVLEFQRQHQSFQWIFRVWIFIQTFRFDWFDLLAVWWTLKNLLQQHNLKASVLWCSAFSFKSHICIWLSKNIALTIWTFDDKVMSLLLNMLSRLVITFLPRSKRLLISWLQSLSTVVLEPKKIKSVTVSTFSPSICHEVLGPDARIFVFF